jgi:rare lipoprotein A
MPAPLPSPSPLPVKLEAVASTGIFVYVGEYETYAKAQSISRALDGFADSPVGIIKNRGPQPYVARLGPLPSMSDANQLLDQLVNAGHLISRIVIQH